MQVDYIDNMGTDLTVVNAARVSMDKESTLGEDVEGVNGGIYFDPEMLKTSDKKLLKYLATHNHWTPFSHPQIMMREKVPLFIARQRFKHMVGFTYNEVSRRYVDTPPELYKVEHRFRPTGSIKQGSGEVTNDIPRVLINGVQFTIDEVQEGLLEWYSEAVGGEYDIAPETARAELPLKMYTEYYVTGSLAAWARAYKQRIDDHAQVEIQELAKEWDKIIRPLYPQAWQALVGDAPV